MECMLLNVNVIGFESKVSKAGKPYSRVLISSGMVAVTLFADAGLDIQPGRVCNLKGTYNSRNGSIFVNEFEYIA